MNVHEIYMTIKEHGTLTLILVSILMTLIQIAPIKFDPWSKLARWIGKIFSGDLSKQIEKIDKKLDLVETRLNEHIEESNTIDLRKRRESILDFASAIAEGKRRYTKEQYEQMLSECDSYAEYCEEKHFKNAVAEESMALIRHAYMRRLLNNSFLNTAEFLEPSITEKK